MLRPPTRRPPPEEGPRVARTEKLPRGHNPELTLRPPRRTRGRHRPPSTGVVLEPKWLRISLSLSLSLSTGPGGAAAANPPPPHAYAHLRVLAGFGASDEGVSPHRLGWTTGCSREMPPWQTNKNDKVAIVTLTLSWISPCMPTCLYL